MTKRSPKAIATLRALASNGASAKEIARAVDVSSTCVAKWAAEEGVTLPTRVQAMKKLNADPAFAAARDERGRERMKKLNADPAFRQSLKAARFGARGVVIPKWVPIDLHDEFLEIAATHGEECAASHARRLKAETKQSEAFA